jgi:hypothetical protein
VKIERRQLTRKERAELTSSRPVLRRIPPPDKADSPTPNAPGPRGPGEDVKTYNTSECESTPRATQASRGGGKAQNFASDLINHSDFTANDKRGES